MVIVKILALIGSWLFFYSILKSRNKRLPRLKATLITFLFAVLIFRVSTDLYALLDRALFSLNKQGEIQLNASPLKIPATQVSAYCKQFTTQDNKILQKISKKNDYSYCGEFWNLDKDDNLILPYKIINSNQILYWASPSLKIIGSKEALDKKQQ